MSRLGDMLALGNYPPSVEWRPCTHDGRPAGKAASPAPGVRPAADRWR
jgi:hypothetical protein